MNDGCGTARKIEEGELAREATIRKFRIVRREGAREIKGAVPWSDVDCRRVVYDPFPRSGIRPGVYAGSASELE